MTRFIIYNNHGEIIKTLILSEADLQHNLNPGEFALETNESELNKYIVNGSLVTFPEKPSLYHLWDWETKTYTLPIEQLNKAKEDKILKINEVRVNLAIAPIPYDNKTLDADTQAQSNINGKLQEIFARESANTPLVSGEMFWKDANNVIHSWNDQSTYKSWLQGLVIAISSRNTALYAIAWTKKAEVEALTDINDIINYDVNVGW